MSIDKAILVGHEVVLTTDMRMWWDWMKPIENRRVALTTLPGGMTVSTVFLGIDYRFFGDDKPLWFETMVFPPDSWSEQDVERYSTRDEAAAGHEQMVAKWRLQEDGDATLQGH